MAVRQYPIVLDGLPRVTILPFRARGIIVTNESSVPVHVTDDAGKTFTTPAGGRMAFNSGLCASPQIASVGAGTGTAEVEFHSQPVDTSGSTPGAQTVANFPNVQNVNLQSAAVALQTNDLTVQANTATLLAVLGLLPANITPITMVDRTVATIGPLTRSIAQFSIALFPVTWCLVDIYYTSGGSTIYVEKGMSVFPLGDSSGIEIPVLSPIPAGALLNFLCQYHYSFGVFFDLPAVVKY